MWINFRGVVSNLKRSILTLKRLGEGIFDRPQFLFFQKSIFLVLWHLILWVKFFQKFDWILSSSSEDMKIFFFNFTYFSRYLRFLWLNCYKKTNEVGTKQVISHFHLELYFK